MGMVTDLPDRKFKCKCGRIIVMGTQYSHSADENYSWLEDSEGNELEEIEDT